MSGERNKLQRNARSSCVAALGVVTQSPELEARHQDTGLGAKVDFCAKRRPENLEKNPRSQIEINQSQPMYTESGIEPGWQWWEAGMMTPAPR